MQTKKMEVTGQQHSFSLHIWYSVISAGNSLQSKD